MKKVWTPLAQRASKFQLSLAPTELLLADMVTSLVITGQTQTKYAFNSMFYSSCSLKFYDSFWLKIIIYWADIFIPIYCMRLTLHTRPLNFNFTCSKTKFACPRQSDLQFSFPVGHNVLTNFEVCDPFTNSRHYPTWFMPKNHRCCEDEVPDSSPLPVMYIWTTDSHSMHCNLYFFNLEANGMKLRWKAWKIHQFFHVMWYQA